MRIYPLSEGRFSIDETKVFKPFDASSPDYPNRPKGSILVEVQPFVIITEKDIILLDTGLGYINERGVLQIHENLMNLGIDPSTITKVFLSHLHKDHAGGISYMHKAHQELFISFPYAKYYIQKRDFKEVIENSKNQKLIDKLKLLNDYSGTIWLNEEKGNIDNIIHYEVTGGHSEFHQVAWIKEQNEIIFFGADVAPQLQQMKSRFIAKYDLDGKKSLAFRKQWWEEGNNANWTFAFYHDISQPTYCSVKSN